MARLGRSFPVNWQFRRPRTSLAIPAAASMAAGFSLTAGASVTGSAELDQITDIGPVSVPPATGELDTSVSLTAGGQVTSNATLPVTATLTGQPSAWIFNWPVPLTYLQYVSGRQVLAAVPGQAVVAIGPASGYAYELAVPPPDGRWVAVGGGGQILALEEDDEDMADPLAWDPPPALAHLPVPFDIIRNRILAGRH